MAGEEEDEEHESKETELVTGELVLLLLFLLVSEQLLGHRLGEPGGDRVAELARFHLAGLCEKKDLNCFFFFLFSSIIFMDCNFFFLGSVFSFLFFLFVTLTSNESFVHDHVK